MIGDSNSRRPFQSSSEVVYGSKGLGKFKSKLFIKDIFSLIWPYSLILRQASDKRRMKQKKERKKI